MKVETWSWGFSYLCPKCETWVGYHSPSATPTHLTYTIDLRTRSHLPKELLARFVCETCGEDLTIEVAEFGRG